MIIYIFWYIGLSGLVVIQTNFVYTFYLHAHRKWMNNVGQIPTHDNLHIFLRENEHTSCAFIIIIVVLNIAIYR